MLKALNEERLSMFGMSRLEKLIQRMGFKMTPWHRLFLWVILAWVPLLVFSIVGGIHSVQITFFEDFPIHIRLLLGIAILILGQTYVDSRLKNVIPILVERGMITEENAPQVSEALTQVRTKSNAFFSEVLALLGAIAIVQSHELIELPQQILSWKTAATPSAALAHSWYRGVSLVIYHFILLGWVWRYYLWFYFLFHLSKSHLVLQSHHPDRLGGLSFLLGRHAAFCIQFFVISIVFSGNIGGMVLHGGANLNSYLSLILLFFVLTSSLILVPLLVFTPLLIRTKRQGLRLYGRFASRHSKDFEKHWDTTSVISGESPLGVREISSNADLDTSYSSLYELQLILMTRRYLFGFACYALLPFLPLALLKIPLIEILEKMGRLLV